ncbi:MAG: DIP1984 family protein [Desulfuromonadaceae bacterium]|nr:DIP1984 family protein [Desulfuromonadaceae bacterium]
MKLAEALIARADIQKRIGMLRGRLAAVVKVQEGDVPAESPADLMAELRHLTDEMELLVKRINRTNSVTLHSTDTTLSDALATRDMLQLKQAIYRQVSEAGRIEQNRYSRSEVRFVSTINIGDLQKMADGLAQQHRELDSQVQCLNWNTELME